MSNVDHDSSDGGGHEVHFQVDQLPEHDSEIVVKHTSDERRDIHLGFLQIKHVYEVQFTIKDDLGEDIECDPLQNLNVRMTEYMPSDDGEGHVITLSFSAYKEKLLKERIEITSKDDTERYVTLVLNARVLGKGKGTPSVRKGIKVLRVEWDEDSDQTDWQGFD